MTCAKEVFICIYIMAYPLFLQGCLSNDERLSNAIYLLRRDGAEYHSAVESLCLYAKKNPRHVVGKIIEFYEHEIDINVRLNCAECIYIVLKSIKGLDASDYTGKIIDMLNRENNLAAKRYAIKSLAEIGPGAVDGITLLLKYADSNNELFGDAIDAVIRIDRLHNKSLAVDIKNRLKLRIENGGDSNRIVSLYLMGLMGVEAIDCAPLLEKIANTEFDDAGREAAGALKKIKP